MRKIIFYLLLLISTVSFGQTTIANKLKITAAIKDNLASRVMVQDSLTGELKWVLKNSLGTVKSVTGTSGVTVALGTSTPVIGLGAITPTSTNGVSATTMAYNDATSSIQTQLNGKQPVGTYATGTGSATGTNTGDNAVNTLYSGLVTNATHTGEVTGATALTITPKAVTLAKMDDVATGTVFYRKTAATGTPEVQTLATLKTDLGLTGTNSGDQTTVSGNAGTATTLQTGRTIAITGDLAYTSPTFNGSANVTATGTLATVNANVGSFTNASVTVNAKGLVTAASSGPTPQAALSGTGLVRSTAGAITYDTNAYITTVNGTAITPSSTNGVSAATMAFNDATSSIQTQLNGKQASGTYATGTGTASGTNTGDNAVNSLYSGLVTNATHTGDATGSTALSVVGINGTLLSSLGTGILKNTTTTGVPSIAIASDFPTLNQNTTGTASNITGVYGGAITSGQVTTALTYTPENVANKQNSLTVDGSGVKYSTVDAVNAGLATKQNTITNPVTGTGAGTTNTIPKFTGVNALGDSSITDTGTLTTISTNLGIGSSAIAQNLRISKNLTGATSAYGIVNEGAIQSDVTGAAYYHRTTASTQATAFTTSTLGHYVATQGTFGAGSTVTTQYGFGASATIAGATNNYGFTGNLVAGTNNYNLYMSGTAKNYLAGQLGVGTTTPIGRVNIFTGITGADFSMSGQQNGSISFSNAGTVTAIPTMSSKSNDGTGLLFVAGTNDVNSSPDMRFDARTNTSIDFTTLTTPAFKFTRAGNSLIDILRNGNVLIGTTVDNGWKFRVNGGAYLDGNIVQSISDSRINGGDTVGRLIVSNSGTTTYLGLYGSAHATTPNTFSLVTNAAERINVNASGVVKISSLASGTTTQMVTADLNGNLGYQAIPSGGTTNLGYTASPTNGIVTSDTGTDATIPLADGTNAGLLAPAGFTNLSNAVLTNNDQTITGLKTFDRSATNPSSGINLSVGTGSGSVLAASTTGSNTAVSFSTSSSGIATNVSSSSTGTALNVRTTSSGLGLVINSDTGSTGNPFTIQNAGVETFSVNKVGDININKAYAVQVAPTAKTATATLTIAEILTNITTVTSTTAVTLTLPTGTLTDAGVQSGTLAVNESFEWTVINLGSSSGAVTMASGTGHTYVGATSVEIGTSATFRTRKTAANTFVTYRI